PGRNITGVTSMATELVPKQFELLHEAVPAARKIVLLVNPDNPFTTQGAIEGAQMASRRLGVQLDVLHARAESDLVRAFAAMSELWADALVIGGDAYLNSLRQQIASLALRRSLPAVSTARDNVIAGMLMSYGAYSPDAYRQAGIYV